MKKIFSMSCLAVLLFLLFGQSVSAMQWEVGILAKDGNDTARSVTVEVYTYNPVTHEWVFCDSGPTSETSFWDSGYEINGYFDIGDGGSAIPILYGVPYADRLAIKIGSKFFDLIFEGGSGYGDMVIHYNASNANMSLYWKSSGCNYSVSGPHTWSEYNISLRNDFGNDRSSCYGNIYLNSELLTNVGYSGVTEVREAQTFPHTSTAIDGQTINNYYRKWKYWNEGNVTNLTIQIPSAATYELVAKFAKRVSNNLTSNYNSAVIKINGTPKSLPLSGEDVYAYDGDDYTFEAQNSTTNYVSYTFVNWTYNGTTITQNSYTVYGPSTHINLCANYTGTPIFNEQSGAGCRNLSVSTSLNEPLHLSWNEHPNTDVTDYRIYRRVRLTPSWDNPTLIGTVSRGTLSFDDPDYMYVRGANEEILYDVRAYCSAYGTESSALFQGPYFGELYKKNTPDEKGVVEYSLNNYPNPFNPVTKISFSIKENGLTKVQVYDILGNKVADLVNEYLTAGSYEAPFDASRLPSGTYIYTIKSNNYSAVKKMLLVK